MKESLIMSAEFVLESLLMYLIFLVGSFTTAKFFKDEDRYYNNRKKFIVLSGVIYILVSFIKVSLNIRYIIFALINGLLFNQLFEEKINRLVISNLYIILLSSMEYSIFWMFEVKLFIIELIVLIMLFGLDKCIYKFNLNIDRVKEFEKKNIRRVIISYMLILGMIITGLYVFSSNIDIYNDVSLIVLMLISIILINFNIVNKYKLNKDLAYIENLEKDNSVLTKENDKIRIFKHDFNNIIQAMNGYIQTEDIPALKTYVKKMIKDVNDTDEENLGNKYFLNNKAMANLLSRKYKKAKSENVNIKFEIMFELSLLNKYEYEFIRILGIFLDNAIEAVREEEDKDIEVLFLRDGEFKTIIIENSCTKNVDINKIYTKDFSTKKGNTGLGLWEVKNIVEKNSNFSLSTTCENNRFKHKLVIV